MKKIIIILISLFFILINIKFCLAEPGVLDVYRIIKKANIAAMYRGKDFKCKTRLIIKDKENRIRIREFHSLRKNSENGSLDQKYFVYFKMPADVRKMTFLVHKHFDINKEDDRWLYMPAMDLVKRIAGSDKRTSFAGSDFLYEDISGRNPLDDKHILLKETSEFYIIKNIPIKPEKVEFDYYIVEISKKNFLPYKIEYYKKGDRLYRIIKIDEVQNIKTLNEGKEEIFPTAVKSSSENLENGSKTEMINFDMKYNNVFEKKMFEERFLRNPPREAIR